MVVLAILSVARQYRAVSATALPLPPATESVGHLVPAPDALASVPAAQPLIPATKTVVVESASLITGRIPVTAASV